MLKIAETRKDRGVTQKQLAEKLGIYQSNMSNWENGVTEPDMQSLVRLADILEVSTDYLLGRTNDVGLIEVNANLSNDENELIILYRKMSYRDKNQLLGFAKGLVY